MTKSELAHEYSVTINVFYSWLKAMEFYTKFPESKQKQYLKPFEVAFIRKTLDEA
jgi:hypothetical protein